VLAEIAHASGLDADARMRSCRRTSATPRSRKPRSAPRRSGISGVPFFIVDGRYGLSGAQPAEAIVEALRRAQQPQAAD
jgi:predicted DsbA family dithiol-disulfide isomerase